MAVSSSIPNVVTFLTIYFISNFLFKTLNFALSRVLNNDHIYIALLWIMHHYIVNVTISMAPF